MVSIKCVDNKGTLQGEIIAATDSEITLTKAFRDGIPCESLEAIVRCAAIVSFRLIYSFCIGCLLFC